jgi:hypothetical protein
VNKHGNVAVRKNVKLALSKDGDADRDVRGMNEWDNAPPRIRDPFAPLFMKFMDCISPFI